MRVKMLVLLCALVVFLGAVPTWIVSAQTVNCADGICRFSLSRWDANYTANMKLGLERMGNGSWVIPAGQTKSFNATVGQLTEANGYYSVYVNGQMVPAAGLCDVASFFNYTGLRFGLKTNPTTTGHPFIPGIDDPNQRVWIWNPGMDVEISNPFDQDVTYRWQITSDDTLEMWVEGGSLEVEESVSSVEDPNVGGGTVATSNDGGSTESQNGNQNFVESMETKDWIIAALAASVLFLLGILVFKKSEENVVIVLDDRHIRWDPFDLSEGRWWYNTIKGSLDWLPWIAVMIFYLLVPPEAKTQLALWLENRGVTWYGCLALLVGMLIYWYFRTRGYYVYPQKNGDLEVRKRSIPWRGILIAFGSLAVVVAVVWIQPWSLWAKAPRVLATTQPPLFGGTVELKAEPGEWVCDFDPIAAGLGPVVVSCDANGFPTFPIRYWNGNNEQFTVDPDVWYAIEAATSDRPLQLVLLAIAFSESPNYQNVACSEVGACGVWQFMPGTFDTWTTVEERQAVLESGVVDDARFFVPLEALAAARMEGSGSFGDYSGNGIAVMDQSTFESCFQGVGCHTWNQHQPQANLVWRLYQALLLANR